MTIIRPSVAFKAGADWVSAEVRAYMKDQVATHVDKVADVRDSDLELTRFVHVRSKGALYRLNLSSGSEDDGDTVLRDNVGRRYEKVPEALAIVAWDEAVDDLAERDTFDDEGAGFVIIVADVGDGRAAYYVMGSGGSGDWSDPFYLTGPQGPVGDITPELETLRDESIDARGGAEDARDEARDARDAAIGAAEATGVSAFFDSYADADAALPGLAEGDIVEVLDDEEEDGRNTRYRVESGVLVLKLVFGSARFAELVDDDTFATASGDNVASAESTKVYVDTMTAARTTGITVNVGSGGDFATINQAVGFLDSRRPAFIGQGFNAIVHLLSGFTMAEQLLVSGIDLSWIRITAAGTVTIARSALTVNFGIGESSFPAIGGREGARLPFLDCNMTMDTSGTAANRDGILAIAGSEAFVRPNRGIANCGGTGLNIQRNSRALAHQGKFPNCAQYGIWAGRRSGADAAQCDVSGAGLIGLYAYRSSWIESHSSSDLKNCGTHAAHVFVNSWINCTGADGSGAGSHAFYGIHAGGMFIGSANGSNAGGDGVRGQASTQISASSFVANGCVGYGLNSFYGANISAQAANVSGNLTGGARAVAANIDIVSGNAQMGGSPASGDISVQNGGIIRAAGATGGTNVTKNTLATNGIIWG